MINLKKASLPLLFISLIFHSALSQQGELVPIDSKNWVFNGNNFKITEYQGKKALHIEEGGFVNAFLMGSKFKDGIIRFKMLIDDSRQFPGVNFRIKDTLNYENFYIRPHQSGNPDATQYTPVYNGLAAWQLYHGPNYTQSTNFKYDDWIDIKLLVKNKQAEVYINSSSKPVLFISELHHEPKSGMVGFTGEKGYYADFSYEENPTVTLQGKSDYNESELKNSIIQEWWVSNKTFNESIEMSKNEIPISLKSNSAWSKYKTDNAGRLNLSRMHILNDGNDLAYAKFTIEPDNAILKKLNFGFSDRVKIFLNGRPIYYGDNRFKTRDYRFLGSIGFFDSVYLPLIKGKNEIVFAVGESFGGWGIMGKLE